MKTVAVLAACAALAGCASNSGAYSTGPDSYKITTTAITSFGGAGTAMGAATKTANETCAKSGKRAVFTGNSTAANIAGASVDVAFRCE